MLVFPFSKKNGIAHVYDIYTGSQGDALGLSQTLFSPLTTAASRAKMKKGQLKPKVTSKCKKQRSKYPTKCAYSNTSTTPIAASEKEKLLKLSIA